MNESLGPQARRGWTWLLPIVLMGAIAIYAFLAWRYPLVPTLPQLRANIGSLTKNSWNAALWLALGGSALHGFYILGALVVWRTNPTRSKIALIWGGAIVAALVLAAIFPVTSTDIFDYLFRGRIGAHYGKNPYIALPNQFPTDPFERTVGWPNAPSAYGPLWELMSQALAKVGGDSLARNVILHKIVAVLTYLACGGVIWRIARPAGRQMQLVGSFLWLWSPLALWEIVAAGHNDGLMVLAILLGLWAAEHGRTRAAVLALTIGTLFKFLPIILLPLVVIHGMRSRTRWWRRILLGAECVALFAVLTVAAYQPFWEGSKTLHNIAVREQFVTAAPLAVVSYWTRQPQQIALLNGFLAALLGVTRLLAEQLLPSAFAKSFVDQLYALYPAFPKDLQAGVSRIGSGLLALGLIWQSWRIWRGRNLRLAIFGLLLWFLAFGSQWFQPWYVLWLLGLLAIRPDRRTWSWLAAWMLAGQTSYLIQFFVQPQFAGKYGAAWGGQSVLVQSLYCALIFVPPLLVWGLGELWQTARRRRRVGQAHKSWGPERPDPQPSSSLR